MINKLSEISIKDNLKVILYYLLLLIININFISKNIFISISGLNFDFSIYVRKFFFYDLYNSLIFVISLLIFFLNYKKSYFWILSLIIFFLIFVFAKTNFLFKESITFFSIPFICFIIFTFFKELYNSKKLNYIFTFSFLLILFFQLIVFLNNFFKDIYDSYNYSYFFLNKIYSFLFNFELTPVENSRNVIFFCNATLSILFLINNKYNINKFILLLSALFSSFFIFFYANFYVKIVLFLFIIFFLIKLKKKNFFFFSYKYIAIIIFLIFTSSFWLFNHKALTIINHVRLIFDNLVFSYYSYTQPKIKNNYCTVIFDTNKVDIESFKSFKDIDLIHLRENFEKNYIFFTEVEWSILTDVNSPYFQYKPYFSGCTYYNGVFLKFKWLFISIVKRHSQIEKYKDAFLEEGYNSFLKGLNPQNYWLLINSGHFTHNSYLNIVSRYGLIFMLIFFFYILYLCKKNNNYYFNIFIILVLLSQTFDDYLLGNRSEASFMIWLYAGIFYNFNSKT